MPGRLREEIDLLRSRPDATMVSCGVRFVGPKDEFLYEISHQALDQTSALNDLDVCSIRGPAHHGCTMFRRDAYLGVGGYRRELAVAQDLDLWLRLTEKGRHLCVSNVGYQASVRPGSISGQS